MDLKNLEQVLIGQPQYRRRQITEAVFQQLIGDWEEAKTLPAELRKKLAESCPLSIEAKIFSSHDGLAQKALLTLDDGLKVETVLMRHDDGRRTICVSCEVGCPMGCTFCATGHLGFKRNLDKQEIIEQALLFNRLLKPEHQRVSGVVFMGMGEPFLNYDEVLGAIKILHDPEYFNIGARHISISTVGVIEGIKKLSNEKLPVNLAWSLHAPNNTLRSKLMPVNKKYPLEKVVTAVNNYIDKTNRRVMIEYIMIKGINDSVKHAAELVELLKQIESRLFFVNLIPFNPTFNFERSTPPAIKNFQEILKRQGITATQRYRFAGDIKAACGQLAGK